MPTKRRNAATAEQQYETVSSAPAEQLHSLPGSHTEREAIQAFENLSKRVNRLIEQQRSQITLQTNTTDLVIELDKLIFKASLDHSFDPNDLKGLRLQHMNAIKRAMADSREEQNRKLQVILEEAESLARQSAGDRYDPVRTREQIDADFQTLREHCQRDGIEFARVAEHYQASREQSRKAAMLKEIDRVARAQAHRDFNHDPSNGPGDGARRALEQIIRSYADIQDKNFLSNTALDRFESVYAGRHERLFNTRLNWAQRQWHSFRGALKSLWNGIRGAVSGVIEAVGSASAALYEGAKAVVSLATDAVVSGAKFVADTAVATVKVLTDKDTYVAIWNGACDIASAVWNAGAVVVNFLGDGDTWRAVGNGLKAAWNFATAKETWQAIGTGLEKAWDFISSQETWKAVGNALVSAAAVALDPRNLVRAARFVAGVISDPIGSIKAAWRATAGVRRFLKDMSDQIGLTDLVTGAWHLMKTPAIALYETGRTIVSAATDFTRVLSGEITAEEFGARIKSNIKRAFSNTTESISKGLSAIKGAVLLAGEVTGITDLVLCVKCALKGDWIGAGLHATFALMSAGTIAATIATAGAAAPTIAAVAMGRTSLKTAGKQLIKIGSKEFFERGAKALGKQAIERLEKSLGEALAREAGQEFSEQTIQALGREALQQSLRRGAVEIADRGSRELAERVLKEGSQALTGDAVRVIMRDSSAEITERILREAGLVKAVMEPTKEFLEEMSQMSTKQIQERLLKEGVTDKRAARAAAREIQRAIRSGRSDAAIKEIFEEGMTKEIREYVEQAMEDPFKKRFRGILKGEVSEEYSQTLSKAAREQAQKLGKEIDEFVEELVEEGWKGVREGIEKAVRKLVREGIHKAFRAFRARMRPRLSGRHKRLSGGLGELEQRGESPLLEIEEAMREASERDAGRDLQAPQIVALRTSFENHGDSQFAVDYERDRKGEWRRTRTRLIRTAPTPEADSRKDVA